MASRVERRGIVPFSVTPHSDFYVATDGATGGSGTITDPIALETALESTGWIPPGATIWLRGGTYTGGYTATINGKSDNPVSIKPYPGESAIIDGYLTINGQYTDWRNIEIKKTGWARETEETGSDPSDIDGGGLVINGLGTKVINCIIHDVEAVAFWSPAYNAIFSGCLIYYVGWQAPDRGHGHALYTQNTMAGTKVIKDNILFHCFGNGLNLYGSGGDFVGYSVIGNTSFGAGELASQIYKTYHVGGEPSSSIVSPVIRANMEYDGNSFVLGYQGGATDVVFEDNYLPNGLVESAAGVTYASNTGNTIGELFGSIGNKVVLRPNEYDSDRAHLTIYNEAEADTVQVDVSAAFNAGDNITARNVQDYWTDTQGLTVAQDGTITVDMQAVNRSVADPVGWPAPDTTFPRFGCYVLERTT